MVNWFELKNTPWSWWVTGVEVPFFLHKCTKVSPITFQELIFCAFSNQLSWSASRSSRHLFLDRPWWHCPSFGTHCVEIFVSDNITINFRITAVITEPGHFSYTKICISSPGKSWGPDFCQIASCEKFDVHLSLPVFFTN